MISVLIVNFNAGAWLQSCLNALARQDYGNFEAIILDNGSTDGSLESLILPDKRFNIYKFGRNLGFAAANNAGACIAKGTWLATLNPDAFPEPHWLKELFAATQKFTDSVMFGSTQWLYDRPGVLDGAGDCLFFTGRAWRGGFGHHSANLPPEGEIFSPCAAAALYRADVFKKAGGFRESLFCYNEDVDLGFRLRLMGHRAIQASKAEVRHVSSGISGKMSGFAAYHGQRNSIWVSIINMPWPLLVISLPAQIFIETLLLTAKLPETLFGRRRVKKRKLWLSMARGFIHGFSGARLAWRERKCVQAKRTISAAAFASSICWSPFEFLRKAVHIKTTA